MSTTTFEDDSLIKHLKDSLHTIEFDPSWLTIEVVEDMGFNNMERANDIFESIRALGISVALDDFGKGYSSLAYLEKLKFDILKIDKTLIDNIHITEKSYEIFKAITRLAEIMAIKVVAEGVEYPEQVAILNEKPNTIAQGYFYSKPITLKAFETYIQNKRKNKSVTVLLETLSNAPVSDSF
jgi:EAL domain-containing protein (putative c-di-GMP-specific phosphodiesterase class I)